MPSHQQRARPRTDPRPTAEEAPVPPRRAHHITVREGEPQRVGDFLIRVDRKRRHAGQFRVTVTPLTVASERPVPDKRASRDLEKNIPESPNL